LLELFEITEIGGSLILIFSNTHNQQFFDSGKLKPGPTGINNINTGKGCECGPYTRLSMRPKFPEQPSSRS
jgi:hypothetical protein